MRLRSLLFLGALLLSLTGCAVDPKIGGILGDLKKVQESSEVIRVPDRVSYRLMGAFGKVAEVHLLPGTFRLQWRTASGGSTVTRKRTA